MKKTAEASKIGSGKIQLKLVKFFKTLSIAQFLSKMLQIFSTFLSLLIVNTARIKANSKNFYIKSIPLQLIMLPITKLQKTGANGKFAGCIFDGGVPNKVCLCHGRPA